MLHREDLKYMRGGPVDIFSIILGYLTFVLIYTNPFHS